MFTTSLNLTENRVHIIGGGIAGLSVGILLSRLGVQVSCYEKRSTDAFAGMGFLLTPNGVKMIKHIFGAAWKTETFFTELSCLTLNNLETGESKTQVADEMWGVLRPILTSRLEELFISAGGVLLTEYSLSSISFSESPPHRIERLHFITPKGDLELKAEMVIGADGISSKLRQLIFKSSIISESSLTEYVGLNAIPKNLNIDRSKRELLKHYWPSRRQAFGYMILPNDQLIWYAQMRFTEELPAEDGDPRRSYLLERYKDWPEDVATILNTCSFERTYRWDTRDLVVMPTAFKSGVMLIGDAAHASLTISSQGVSSALEDAVVFAQKFNLFIPSSSPSVDQWDQLCKDFDALRHSTWLRRQNEARRLQDLFLSAKLDSGVPFVRS